MQDKAVLGTRYTCYGCGCKFYDLNRPTPTCPRCEANQIDDPTPDSRVAAMTKVKAAKAAKKAAAKEDAGNESEGKEKDATEEVALESTDDGGDENPDQKEGDSPEEASAANSDNGGTDWNKDMKKDELAAVAKEKGLKVTSKMTKKAILAALEGA